MEITDDLGVYMEEDNNMDIEGGLGAWVLGEPSTFLGLRLYVPIALLIVAHLLLEHLLPPILG